METKKKNTYYLSIGENCLTDNILYRFDIKSFSTPYSHGRSNIDYAIHLEMEKYRNLLTADYLYYDFIGEKKVVRNKHYSKSDIIFSPLHLNGFEFTHHDVIDNKVHLKSYQRKAERMCTLDKSKKLKLVYHYRNNENKYFDLLIRKLQELLAFYQAKGIRSEMIFFTQEIIARTDERALVKIHDTRNIKGFVLKTLETWAGDDEDVFWARKDDDLLSGMIKDFT